MTPQERTAIRAQLRLRYDVLTGTYEVYTTIHGTGIFKWFIITEETAIWYERNFGLVTTSINRPDIDTGHINP